MHSLLLPVGVLVSPRSRSCYLQLPELDAPMLLLSPILQGGGKVIPPHTPLEVYFRTQSIYMIAVGHCIKCVEQETLGAWMTTFTFSLLKAICSIYRYRNNTLAPLLMYSLLVFKILTPDLFISSNALSLCPYLWSFCNKPWKLHLSICF